MKNLLITLATIALISASSSAYAQKAIMKFDTMQHDFGNVVQGQKAIHEFKFVNTGDAPLVIDEVKTTCSCTASDWPKEPILPGKESSIKVEFDTKDKMGFYAKGVNIFSNAGESNLVVFIVVMKS